jgi:hypothetical protein
VEEGAFGAAVRSGSAKAYVEYLRARPQGRFTAAARGELSRRFDEARSGLDLDKGTNPPFRAAFLEELRALEAKAEVGMPVLVSWEMGADAEAAAQGEPALREALSPSAQSRRAQALVQQLRSLIAQSSLSEVAPIEGTPAQAASHALRLKIVGLSGLDGSQLAGGPVALQGLRVSWLVTLTGEGETKRFEWRTDSQLHDRLVLDATESATLPQRGYAAQLDAAGADFLTQLTAALGLGVTPRAPKPTAQTASVSPYLR